MNPCNYNWNIAILNLRKSHIYFRKLYFEPYIRVYYFSLNVEDQDSGSEFLRKSKERNFRYISNRIKTEMSDSFIAYYYFDNLDNQMEIYLHTKERWLLL